MTAVKGMVQCLARFARAEVAAEVAAQAAAKSAAQEIAETARSLVPVDTGTLHDSIEVNDAGVGIGAPYAVFVEFGTSQNPAQPYVRPAMDEVKDTGSAAAAEAVIRRI
jgi:HK97 gp10 family phage protein